MRRNDERPHLMGDEARARIRNLLSWDSTLFVKVQTTGLGSDAEVLTLTLMDASGSWTQRAARPCAPISPETTLYTGVTQEDADRWDRWSEGIAPDIAGLFSSRILAGWNVSFDLKAIASEQSRIGAPDPASAAYGTADMMELYCGAAGLDTRFLGLAKALGRKPPVDPVEYLEAEIELLRRICNG